MIFFPKSKHSNYTMQSFTDCTYIFYGFKQIITKENLLTLKITL